MSFQHYPAYRESGLAWIGPVPSHWTVSRLKHVLAEMGSGGTPDTDDPTMWAEPDDEGTAWVAIGDMSSVDLVLSTAKRITARALASKRLQVWPKGTLLFSMYASLGHVAVLGVDAAINQALLALSPNKCTQAFLRHWLSYLQPRLVEQASRNTQDNLNAEKVRGLPVAFPGADEQLRIAAFLDRETAKIDALVEEQRRLIELLKEKRQAVISQAVTKGLDPNVPVKDSGVEWLGEVPAHWGVFALKREVEFVTSGARGWADNYSDDGKLFLRIGNLTRDTIRLDLSDVQRVIAPVSAETERTRVHPGDLLFSITAYLGSVAVVPDGLEPAYVSQHVALVRLKRNRLVPEWAAYVAASHVGRTFLETQGYGGTKIQLSLSDVANMLMLLPKVEEQRAIVEHIERETLKLDCLIDGAASAMRLLQERRSALISAAVTGKIDVRSLALQPEGAAA